jgi:HEAT repeat protein
MDPRALVKQLARREGRLEVIRCLAGGVTATELRQVRVDQLVLDALAEGIHDPDPRVRWWCVQLLDHLDDPRALAALAAALDDPVPRVRRNAAHALGCVACKPSWDGSLPGGAAAKLRQLAAADPNPKVRAEAQRTLGRLTQPQTVARGGRPDRVIERSLRGVTGCDAGCRGVSMVW